MHQGHHCTLWLLLMLWALPSVAAVDVTRLDGELTPVGAERAGNAEGSIPPWTGGITEAPAGYRPGQHHLDPFADDAVQFSIRRDNVEQYQARLSAGQIAMFKAYPGFRMDIYPTRRSASFPERIYAQTRKNAEHCKLVAEGEGVAGCAEGLPFPIPENGMQVIWNHKLKYKGVTVTSYANQAVVTNKGDYTLIRVREQVYGLYYLPGNTSESIENILLYYQLNVLAPPRLAGQALLVHETLNAASTPRSAWVYNPGQRRVRSSPQVSYDNPGTASDGMRTTDMADMFNGAMDRFDWELVGKREMYVPYNSYVADSDRTLIKDLIRPHHLNPDKLRYELHRVWVVEARLKAGTRHVNSRRTFYLDEDSWQILLTDHYAGDGKLWRYSEAPSINYYEVPVFWSALETHHDLRSGRYNVLQLDNQDKPRDFSARLKPADFSPQALRSSGVR